MQLRRLEIQHFRGIRCLDWRHIGKTAAIVGPGDSGKSTILDAIERALSPRWSVPFDDTDFYGADPSKPIVIRCTVTNIPDTFYRDNKYGLLLHGFDPEEGTVVPASGSGQEQQALLIELRVDASLEPLWWVVDGAGREHLMPARDREALGMLRVGGFLDVHMGWSRGSVLARLTESGDAVGAVLAEASRQARAGLNVAGLARLNEAATRVETIGRQVGAAPTGTLVPHIDVGSFSMASGALSLHDGVVPLRRSGLGTRRLFAVAMQREAAAGTGITLVDEFEQGLEPHRIRRLLRVLRGTPPENSGQTTGQLLLTTHSPTVLSELTANEVYVARRDAAGSVTIACLPRALGYVLPRVPEALLARRVIVAEGATEEGLCIALDQAWTDDDGASFAYRGVAVVDGEGGTQPAEVAGHLAALGYKTALLVDSDATAKTSRARGATVLAWSGRVCTEERLAADLPLEAVRKMTVLAAASPKAASQRAVGDCLADALQVVRTVFSGDPGAWVDVVDEAAFRTALGTTAKRLGWFKRRDLGHALGTLVAENWVEIAGTPTRQVLDGLRSFAHDD